MPGSEYIYERCSTHAQDFDMQDDAIQRAFGDQVSRVEHMKDVCSGSRSSRPHYDRLKGMIAKGLVRVVYIYSWDRVSRTVHEMASFAKLCRAHKCEVKSVCNNIDLASDFGDIIVVVLGIVAQVERRMIVQRMTAALRRKVLKEGWRAGGSSAGWISKKNRAKAPTVYALLDARKPDGKPAYTINKICVQLHLDHRTVARLVKLRGANLPKFNRDSGVNYKNKKELEELYQGPFE